MVGHQMVFVTNNTPTKATWFAEPGKYRLVAAPQHNAANKTEEDTMCALCLLCCVSDRWGRVLPSLLRALRRIHAEYHPYNPGRVVGKCWLQLDAKGWGGMVPARITSPTRAH